MSFLKKILYYANKAVYWQILHYLATSHFNYVTLYILLFDNVAFVPYYNTLIIVIAKHVVTCQMSLKKILILQSHIEICKFANAAIYDARWLINMAQKWLINIREDFLRKVCVKWLTVNYLPLMQFNLQSRTRFQQCANSH